jgi:xylan 1,4-beta-xylosidase
LARNPVVRGFAPDPSIVRGPDDWYYVATSSFEWFPTIPIYRSRDLADWEYAGHVRGAIHGNSLAGVPDSGGVWAPSLSWDGERFWVTYSVVRSLRTPYFDLDTYVTTAPDVTGPWAVPRRVPSHGFDPALFHHEGRIHLVNLQTDHRPGGRRFSGIVLTELDRDTFAPLGPTHLLLQHDDLVEGPKLLHREGWFILLVAHGGTGFEHGVLVARSRSLTGPYELDSRPLLTSRDDPSVALQKAGHAELVRTPDGAWFLSHLAARPLHTPEGRRCTLGREAAIQAVVWDADGWPRLRQGGHHPAVEVEVPAVADASPEPPVDEDPLGWPWSTLREPSDPSWADTTSRPGWIRLRGRHGPESRWAHSLLAQRMTEHRAHAEVTVDAQPTTFTQAAGLVLRYDAVSYLALDVTWAEPEGESQRGQQWRGAGRRVLSLVEHTENGARQAARVPLDTNTPLTLGVEIDGAAAQFWYRPEDAGVSRILIGPALDFSRLSDDLGERLRFTGSFAGIHVDDLVDAAFTADFSGFRLTPV